MAARRRTAQTEPQGELAKLVGEIESKMGAGVAVRGSAMPRFTHIPTGSFLLDLATVGGFVENAGHMLYGYESTGKTTLCLLLAAQTQRKYPDGQVVWVDAEDKFDRVYAEKLGVDLDRIVVIKPLSGEHAVDVLEAAARAIEVKALFLDSIPSLCPVKIVEKSAEEQTVAERARLVGLLCSKLQQARIAEGHRGHKVTFFCVNQFRMKIGVMFGDPRTLPGGRFLQHLADFKLELKVKEIMEDDSGIERHVLNEHPFKFTKTKAAFSIKQGETRMVMNDAARTDGLHTGDFDDYKAVMTWATKRGLMTGGGGHYSYAIADGRFHGLAAAEEYLRQNRDAYTLLQQCLLVIQRRESRLDSIPTDRYLLEYVDMEREERIDEIITGAAHA